MVDTREDTILKHYWINKDIKLKKRELPVGDYTEDIIVIERKKG